MAEVEIPVTFPGAAEGAVAVDAAADSVQNLDRSARELAQSSGRLRRELRVQRSQTSRVRSESRKAARAVKELKEETEGAERGLEEATNSAGQAAGALGNIGSVLGQVNPAMGEAAGLLGQVGSAASASAGSLGSLGVVGAAVAAGAGILTAAINSQVEALERDREAVENLTASFEDILGTIQRVNAERNRFERLSAGRGTVEEQAAFLERTQRQLELTRRALQGQSAAIAEIREAGLTGVQRTTPTAGMAISAAALEFVGAGRQETLFLQESERRILRQRTQRLVRQLEERAASVEAASERTIQTIERESREEVRRIRRGGGRSAADQERRVREELERQLSIKNELVALDQKRAEELDRLIMGEQEQTETLRDIVGELAREQEQRLRRLTEKEEQAAQQRLDAIQKEGDLRERLAEEETERQAELTASFREAGEELGGFFANVFDQANNGEEKFEDAFVKGLKNLLRQLGIRWVAQGTANLLEGVGLLVTNPPAAATKLASGAGLIALGVSVGAAGAAIPTPSAGAGAPAVPRPEGGAGEGGRPTTIVNNFGGPLVTAQTTAQVGRQVGRTLRAGVADFTIQRAA